MRRWGHRGSRRFPSHQYSHSAQTRRASLPACVQTLIGPPVHQLQASLLDAVNLSVVIFDAAGFIVWESKSFSSRVRTISTYLPPFLLTRKLLQPHPIAYDPPANSSRRTAPHHSSGAPTRA